MGWGCSFGPLICPFTFHFKVLTVMIHKLQTSQLLPSPTSLPQLECRVMGSPLKPVSPFPRPSDGSTDWCPPAAGLPLLELSIGVLSSRSSRKAGVKELVMGTWDSVELCSVSSGSATWLSSSSSS